MIRNINFTDDEHQLWFYSSQTIRETIVIVSTI